MAAIVLTIRIAKPLGKTDALANQFFVKIEVAARWVKLGR
jgi:hypothetical protein